jgi:hypothetical protein
VWFYRIIEKSYIIHTSLPVIYWHSKLSVRLDLTNWFLVNQEVSRLIVRNESLVHNGIVPMAFFRPNERDNGLGGVYSPEELEARETTLSLLPHPFYN